MAGFNNAFNPYMNTGYPQPTPSYMNTGYQNYQNMQTPQPQSQQSIIRVTGMDGARAYQMGPNSAAVLFDNNTDIFYIKTTDGAGFPTIQAYSFLPYAGETVKDNPTGDYVLRKEFDEFKNEIDKFKSLLLNPSQASSEKESVK